MVGSRRLFTVGGTAGAVAALVALTPGDAHAHGYVSGPMSRQAQCAQGIVSCGEIKYEPQSAEGPKGLRSCSGGVSRFAELDDDDKGWRVQSVGRTVTFNWTFTAQHRTQNWEYFIGNTRVGVVDGNNQQPAQSVSHTIDLGNFTGRQKLLAVWNIGDTANAFYSCIDLQIGTDGGTTTAPPVTTNPTVTTTNPPTTRPPVTTAPPATTKPPITTTGPTPAGEWKVHAQYGIGDVVTYQGSRYRCRQAHTVHDPNWTPPATPALWQRL